MHVINAENIVGFFNLFIFYCYKRSFFSFLFFVFI